MRLKPIQSNSLLISPKETRETVEISEVIFVASTKQNFSPFLNQISNQRAPSESAEVINRSAAQSPLKSRKEFE